MLYFDAKGRVLTVRLLGELDHAMARDIRDQIDERIGGDIRKLIFDLSGLEFMDSSGIGLIIGRCKRMARHGGVVGIASPTERVEKMLNMAGVYDLVERVRG